jgi:hypothetical protein
VIEICEWFLFIKNKHIDDTIPQFTGEHTGEHPWQPAAEPSMFDSWCFTGYGRVLIEIIPTE